MNYDDTSPLGIKLANTRRIEAYRKKSLPKQESNKWDTDMPLTYSSNIVVNIVKDISNAMDNYVLGEIVRHIEKENCYEYRLSADKIREVFLLGMAEYKKQF